MDQAEGGPQAFALEDIIYSYRRAHRLAYRRYRSLMLGAVKTLSIWSRGIKSVYLERDALTRGQRERDWVTQAVHCD